MNNLGQEMKMEFVLGVIRHTLVHVTLAFDSKVILIIWNLCCHLLAVGSQCAKYEHARKKKEWKNSRHEQESNGEYD